MWAGVFWFFLNSSLLKENISEEKKKKQQLGNNLAMFQDKTLSPRSLNWKYHIASLDVLILIENIDIEVWATWGSKYQLYL